jgi:hypothetical protein
MPLYIQIELHCDELGCKAVVVVRGQVKVSVSEVHVVEVHLDPDEPLPDGWRTRHRYFCNRTVAACPEHDFPGWAR